MIAYEELERALSRWKARRSGAPHPIEEVPQEIPEEVMDGNVTPAAPTRLGDSRPVRSSTGEMDFADAEVDES